MSKIAKALILTLSIITCVSIITSAENNYENTIKYSKMTEKEIKDELKKLKSEELIVEVDKIASEGELLNDYNSVILVASSLIEREDEFKKSEIIDMIESNDLNLQTKEILIDLYDYKSSKYKDSEEDLKNLLYKEDLDDTLKQRIVNFADFNFNDIPVLEDLISDGGLNSFYSLKKLSKLDSEKAYKISENIISNYKSKSGEEISGAILVKSNYLKEKNKKKLDVTKETEDFLGEALQIFNETNDLSIKDAIAYSISDVRSEKTIKNLIKNYNLDKEVKMFAIDQNYMVLEDILKNNPSEEDIYMVIECMKVLPINDFKDEFENLLKASSDKNLIKEINNILTLINQEGINANKKWLEK